MRLDRKDLILIMFGSLIVLFIAHVGYQRSDKTGQPRYQGIPGATGFVTGLNVVDTVIKSLDTGEHYFHPIHCVPGQTQIFTQHKYPTVSGGNISTLIHQGYDRLKVPAPQDDDWRTAPPAEVQF
jgi:hypothetical protein